MKQVLSLPFVRIAFYATKIRRINQVEYCNIIMMYVCILQHIVLAKKLQADAVSDDQ